MVCVQEHLSRPPLAGGAFGRPGGLSRGGASSGKERGAANGGVRFAPQLEIVSEASEGASALGGRLSSQGSLPQVHWLSPEHPSQWHMLARACLPHGNYGNMIGTSNTRTLLCSMQVSCTVELPQA